MFNIGPLEILTVLVIALVVVGPKRLPELARTVGRALNEFRKIQDEVKDMVKFDLGADLLNDADEPAPSYGSATTDATGSTGDGMTHSERVIAALPDEDDTSTQVDEPSDDAVAPLPAVTSRSTTDAETQVPETQVPESHVEAEEPDRSLTDEPAAEDPPAAAAE